MDYFPRLRCRGLGYLTPIDCGGEYKTGNYRLEIFSTASTVERPQSFQSK